MSALYDLARERIEELQRDRDAIDAELATITEIERLAASLNGAPVPPVPRAQASGRATSPGQTQPPADPPRRTPAPRPARKTSRAEQPKRARRVDPAEIIPAVKGALEKLGRATPNGVIKELGYSARSSGDVAVREAVAKLLTAGTVKVDGQIRGRPAYALAAERAIPAGVPAPSATRPAASNVIDKLVGQLVEQLEIDGGRVSRSDLKQRLGHPDPEDFDFAVDRAVNLNKVTRTKVGGLAGYELAS